MHYWTVVINSVWIGRGRVEATFYTVEQILQAELYVVQ